MGSPVRACASAATASSSCWRCACILAVSGGCSPRSAGSTDVVPICAAQALCRRCWLAAPWSRACCSTHAGCISNVVSRDHPTDENWAECSVVELRHMPAMQAGRGEGWCTPLQMKANNGMASVTVNFVACQGQLETCAAADLQVPGLLHRHRLGLHCGCILTDTARCCQDNLKAGSIGLRQASHLCSSSPELSMPAVDCATRRWHQTLAVTSYSREPAPDKTLQHHAAACDHTTLQVPQTLCSPVPSPGSGAQPLAGHDSPTRAAAGRRCAAGRSVGAVQQQSPCQQLQGLLAGWPGA